MKKRIITICVLISIVAIAGILFGTVFCLRHQKVVIVDGSTISVSDQDIIAKANLKKGRSIFMLDKQSAIDAIERTWSDIKVVQIKTTNVTSIEIRIRKRVPMYYIDFNQKYYCLDEDLKVLNIVENIDTINTDRLIYLNTNKLSITDETKVCDFVGKGDISTLAYNLFTSMYTRVKVATTNGYQYADRSDIKAMISNISFGKGNTLTREYETLIIETNAGVKIIIADPLVDLDEKINACFALYNDLAEGKIEGASHTEGYIKYIFNADNSLRFGYTRAITE